MLGSSDVNILLKPNASLSVTGALTLANTTVTLSQGSYIRVSKCPDMTNTSLVVKGATNGMILMENLPSDCVVAFSRVSTDSSGPVCNIRTER